MPKVNPNSPSQQKIDTVYRIAMSHYEKARQTQGAREKLMEMDLFYINFLKPVYDVLHSEEGLQMITVDRYGRSDGQPGHGYVPSFIDKNGITRMSKIQFEYKATALMKLLAAFSSDAGDERIF